MELLVLFVAGILFAVWPPLGWVPFVLYGAGMVYALFFSKAPAGRVKRPVASMEDFSQ